MMGNFSASSENPAMGLDILACTCKYVLLNDSGKSTMKALFGSMKGNQN